MIHFDILTLFPDIFTGFFGESLIADAVERQIIEFQLHHLRDWAYNKHHSVDDRPFGGGPGMLLKPDVVVPAIESICGEKETHIVLFSPQGKPFEQRDAERLAQLDRILFVCGRYEGFDERIIDIVQPEEISIGDFVLNGGEVAAMAVIEATFRLLPGALGDQKSPVEDSFSGEHRWLDCPQYTRPRSYRGLNVPEILVGGNHQAVARWREEVRIERTRLRRPDLFEKFGYPPSPPVKRIRHKQPPVPLPQDSFCDTIQPYIESWAVARLKVVADTKIPSPMDQEAFPMANVPPSVNSSDHEQTVDESLDARLRHKIQRQIPGENDENCTGNFQQPGKD